MALPGLGLAAPLPILLESEATEHDLSPNTEWRFEVDFSTPDQRNEIEVKLLSGTAELFGTELALHQPYIFSGTKAAIYTYHGCRISLSANSSPQSDYTAEETPMPSYLNLHFALENARNQASSSTSTSTTSTTLGPRVLILGQENAGKTTLTKILASYATRMGGGQPLVVNLDAKEGMLSMPGTISAFALESIVDVERGWGSSPTNGPSLIPVKLPLVYYYGQKDPEFKADAYKAVVARLALSVMNRLEDDLSCRYTGVLIDSAGSVAQGKNGYDLVRHIVAEFQVNVIVVVGSERLYSDMTRRYGKATTSSGEAMAVVKLEKSGGCVDRDAEFLQHMHHAQVKEYFFGDARSSLSPHTQVVGFDDVTIYRIPEDGGILDALLPGDTEESASKQIFETVDPSPMLQHCILTIVSADPNDSQENIRDASVIGFVYVSHVDDKKRSIRLLAPLSGRLPRKALILGNWPEPVGELMG